MGSVGTAVHLVYRITSVLVYSALRESNKTPGQEGL